MKKNKKTRCSFFILCAYVISGIIFPAIGCAETVPTPPKRPTKLNVSPSYIEELKNRDQERSEIRNSDDLIVDELTAKDEIAEIVDIRKAALLDVLEQRVFSSVPKPKKKPALNSIEPSSQDEKKETAENTTKDEETALISFVLKPKQISLDENLKNFLKKHAIRLFNENEYLKIEIHAYATPIEREIHSDVRLSLARALEVRSFLISNDINPSRLKLSPMGRDKDNINHDRIDLFFISK